MKLLLLDSNSLLNRAYYALPMLTDKSGRFTGALFGFSSMLSKLIKSENPTHIVAAFDVHAPTFRHLEYDAYKANRHPMPEELRAQVPAMKELLQTMGICVVEKAGFEGDDILGTLAKNSAMPTVIVSGDKDVLQLVSDKTTVIHTKKGITDIIRYTPERLAEDGLTPQGIVELKALMGDKSDNIPGVAGVGEKTAKDLIDKYASLDGIYAHIDEIGGKLKEKLINGEGDAKKSKWLATINTSVPLDVSVDDMAFNKNIPIAAKTLMIGYDFKGLVDRFNFSGEVQKTVNAAVSQNVDVTSEAELDAALDKVRQAKVLCVDISSDKIAFASDAETNYTIRYSFDLFGELLSYDYVVEKLTSLLKDDGVKKYAYDSKKLYGTLGLGAEEIFACEDIMLMAYIADCGNSYDNVSDLLVNHGYKAENIAAELLMLVGELEKKMVQANSLKVYQTLELPLVSVLYSMEREGFCVDCNALGSLAEKYSAEMKQVCDDIYKMAGHSFNVNSPKQLSEVLFDELRLPTGKKRSTSADVLSELEDEHPIISSVLRYRLLSKLISTYLVGMRQMVDAGGKIHTVFNQALTSTGRLSSSEPNLQNIPVREEEGREIRGAFVASRGNVLVSADYSQIELRLLAHFSEDEGLIDAFKRGVDIHAATASKVFNVKESDVDAKMRRNAKAVNFGIIYGISDFGLAKNIGSSVREARDFIAKYFENYPKIKIFMDNSVAYAKEHGYVTTFMGRVRTLPEIYSSNYTVRSFAERAAMNMPLQGSAADIIKLAMIKVQNGLKNAGLKAKLILQVHDELIVDCPESEEQRVIEILKSEMENVVSLRVPLPVNVASGKTWKEAK